MITAGALLGGCHQQVFEPVRDGLVSTAALDGDVRVFTKADLLFVIDDSPSMENEQQKLAAGFPELLAKLDALDPPVDYRAAVMTTSVVERFGPCDSKLSGSDVQCSADWGATGFACEDNACVRRFPDEAGKLVAASGNPAVLERAKLSAADFAQKFAQNVAVGTAGSRHEQPLRALHMAMTSGALDGFWRPDARLVVFIASDEDDCSDSTETLLALEQKGGTIIDHCADEAKSNGNGLDSIDRWVSQFRTLPIPGGTREVALGGAIGLGTGSSDPGTCVDSACAAECQGPAGAASCNQQCQGSLDVGRCVSECVAQCVGFCGSQAPGIRLARAIRAMNGSLSSICESDFGPALSRLARVIGIPESIDLPSVPADDRTFFFRVTRDSKVIECQQGPDYTLDRASPQPAMDIVQQGACRLLPGDHWSIRYVAK
jgi:hypothetical protein